MREIQIGSHLLHEDRQLLRQGKRVSMGPRALAILSELSRHRGRVVSKDELFDAVWSNVAVEENALQVHIGALRKALGPDAALVETVRGVGYQLCEERAPVADEGASAETPGSAHASPAEAADAAQADGAATAGAVDQPSAAPLFGRPSIAGLAFRHPPGDDEQAYFAEGMAEDIIVGLSRSSLLRVISRQSSLSYKNDDAPTTQVCADLSVRYVLRGQIRKMGPIVRVRVDLIDGNSDEVVWSTRQDCQLEEIFTLQDGITYNIVGTIEPAVLTREQDIALKRPQSFQHWDLFIRGRYHYWKSTLKDFDIAEDLLLRALELDPDDSQTLVMLASNTLGRVWAGRVRDFAYEIGRAHAFAAKAVAADPYSAATHCELGIVLTLAKQFDAAMAEQRRALELNTGYAPSLAELGRLLAFRGDAQEALVKIANALTMSPTDPHDWLWLRSNAIACLRLGRIEDAKAYSQDALTRRPDYFFLHMLLAVCQHKLGEEASARTTCQKALELNAGYNEAALRRGHPFAEEAELEDFISALRACGWDG